jgi:hypothetical protein
MRLRPRKLAVLTDLSRPRLGERAEEYAAAQSRPSTGLVTVLGAIGLSADHSRRGEDVERQERFADDLFEFGTALSRAQSDGSERAA